MFIKFFAIRNLRTQVKTKIVSSLEHRGWDKIPRVIDCLKFVLSVLPATYEFVIQHSSFREIAKHPLSRKQALNIAGGLTQMFFWCGASKEGILSAKLDAKNDLAWTEIAAVAIQYGRMPTVVPKELTDKLVEEIRVGFREYVSRQAPAERATRLADTLDKLMSGDPGMFPGEQQAFSVMPIPFT